MSKKQRRTRGQSVPSAPRGERVQTVTEVAPQPVRVPRPPRAAPEQRVKEVDFSKEYHYVIEDLKRIAVYAAALFALLIVLALVFAFAG
jgi:hypothetical protein